MVTLSPVATSDCSTLTELSTLATFKERLCSPFCTDSTIQPQVSIVYTSGIVKFDGTTVFVPVTAVITIVTQCTKCKAKTQLFTETFDVAFRGQSGLPKSVKIESKGRVMGGSDVNCGCAKSYTISDCLSISIGSK